MYGKFGGVISHAKAVEEYIDHGLSPQQIAKKYDMSVREVNAILRTEEKQTRPVHRTILCPAEHCQWGNNAHGICCLPRCLNEAARDKK